MYGFTYKLFTCFSSVSKPLRRERRAEGDAVPRTTRRLAFTEAKLDCLETGVTEAL